ncbi:acyltransferase family protein [soil metagenome]
MPATMNSNADPTGGHTVNRPVDQAGAEIRPHAAPTRQRDVWMDAVRAASLLVVVLGHWLLAVVGPAPDGGDLQFRSLLSAAPEVHWLSLGLQVMGAFFLVGGAVSVTSWRRARAAAADGADHDRRRDTAVAAYGHWLRTRAGRLAGPVLPLMALWAALPPVLRLIGLDPRLSGDAASNALAPLWFLVVYLLVQALVPVIDHATARVGWLRATLALIAGSALVDFATRAGDVAWAGYGGYLVVWVVPVVLGVALADGRLGAREGRWLAAIGAGGVAVLVGLLDYPVLMVGTLPDGGSNQNPPSLALAALILCHVGLLLMTRDRLTRWLSRPRATRVTMLAAAWSMPVFLWHMTAMTLAIGATLVTPAATAGLVQITPLEPLWWLTRPLWWAVMLLWSAPLVLLAARHDRRPTLPPVALGSTSAALLGCLAAVTAIAVGSTMAGSTTVAVSMVALLAVAGGLLGSLPARRDS